MSNMNISNKMNYKNMFGTYFKNWLNKKEKNIIESVKK